MGTRGDKGKGDQYRVGHILVLMVVSLVGLTVVKVDS